MKPSLYPLMFAVMISFSNCSAPTEKEKENNNKQVGSLPLDIEAATNFSKLALSCILKEYPNNPAHVINNVEDNKTPATLHPCFYGCFDWHSSVHGHWMLVKLLRMFPDLPNAQEIRLALAKNLTKENGLVEAYYFGQKNTKSFERTYGWAWLLKLAEELHKWDTEDARAWLQNLQPLTDSITKKYIEFLPKQTYPIRRGVHPNTAFGISFALDYAREVKNDTLERLLVERSMTYFFHDKDAPARWEPDGDDFLSPSLIEADLMRRVLSPEKFEKWFAGYLPQLEYGQPENLLQPAIVSDRTDPKIVHLDGLNLSRAWCMFGIASVLDENNPKKNILLTSAYRNASSSLPNISSGNYEGEHWLASFAVYMLSAKL